MPRNPNKRRCDTPGCRAWAMREHNLCRSHRDHLLGPRGAGAPLGNLNAVKTGRDARLISGFRLQQVAHQIIHHPDDFPAVLAGLIAAVQDRQAAGPFETLLIIRKLCDLLANMVAEHTFVAELDAYLLQLSPARRASFQGAIWRGALQLPSVDKVRFLRMMIELVDRKYNRKTIDGNASTSGK